jgi:hypothetical protein
VEDPAGEEKRESVCGATVRQAGNDERIARLERDVAELREQFAQFRKQFE